MFRKILVPWSSGLGSSGTEGVRILTMQMKAKCQSEKRYPPASRDSVTSQKTLIFSNIDVRTSNLVLCGFVSFRQFRWLQKTKILLQAGCLKTSETSWGGQGHKQRIDKKVTRFLCVYSYNNLHVLTELDQIVGSKIKVIEYRNFTYLHVNKHYPDVICFSFIYKFNFACQCLYQDRLCGLVVRVSGYRHRGLGFDSRRYQIFRVVVGLERGPLSLVRSIEELLE